MKELITKSNDGTFTLTPSGEQELYFITTRKLIQYYLKEALKKDSIAIAEKMNNLSVFIFSNFHNIDDYLQKLPELASFIGEDNIQRFQKFMGQHFVNTLQKEKQIFLKKEIESGKDKLDNPFWVPSYELIKNFAMMFSQAPILLWPPVEIKNPDIDNAQIPAEVIVQNKSEPVQNNITIAEPVKNKPVIQSQPQAITEEPGAIFLKKFSGEFLSAKPLEPLKNDIEEATVRPSEEINMVSPESTPAEEISSEQTGTVTPEIAKKKDVTGDLSEPPGVRLLKQLGTLFSASQGLEMGTASENQTIPNPAQPTGKLLSLKNFASILSDISRFTRAKDNAGYQKWYSTLPVLPKAAIKVNSLISQEKKGTTIDWGREIMMFAASSNGNKDELYKLADEVKLYLKVINLLRQRLTTIENLNLSQQDIANIYSQSVNILSGKELPQEKISSLKILLLQVTDEIARETLIKEYEKIINALK